MARLFVLLSLGVVCSFVTTGRGQAKFGGGRRPIPPEPAPKPRGYFYAYPDVVTRECKITRLGREYAGRVRHTNSGLLCQRWDDQHPHKHNRNDVNDFPESHLSDVHNYCRNPDNEPDGPWCYTTNPHIRWQYCNVPPCECRETKKGMEYNGHIQKTRTGRKCQRWDQQFPHKHTRTNINNFPEDTLAEARNYCRNPDGEPDGPWCYTTDPNVRWEYCVVPRCTENGACT